MVRKLTLVGIASSLVAAGAQAHPGHGPHGMFEGSLHYLNGIEHLAALAVFGAIGVVVWRLRSRKSARRVESRDRGND
jgi:hydrogenase/urease accessory protein HupE